jgi:hypothetical protein
MSARLQSWLRPREAVHRRWLGPIPVGVAWLGLVLALVCPPHGCGFTTCWFRACTGLPCPGCGMTRSLSCALRGMFLESWSYHPLGLLILVLFVTTAAISLRPAHERQRLARYMESHALLFNALYWGFVLTFIGFGVTRALLHLAQICRVTW